jgi:hypothetical protein
MLMRPSYPGGEPLHRRIVDRAAVEARGAQRGADLGRQQRGAQVAARGERLLERLQDGRARGEDAARVGDGDRLALREADLARDGGDEHGELLPGLAQDRGGGRVAALGRGDGDRGERRDPATIPVPAAEHDVDHVEVRPQLELAGHELVQRRARVAAVAHARVVRVPPPSTPSQWRGSELMDRDALDSPRRCR